LPEWNAPTEEEVRAALENWDGPDGVTTENVTVQLIDETSRHPAPEVNGVHPAWNLYGTHYLCTVEFHKGEDYVGNARARYRADGIAYIEQASLVEDYQQSGIITAHFNDMLPHYVEWGCSTIQVWVPGDAGVAWAESVPELEPTDAPSTYEMEAT